MRFITSCCAFSTLMLISATSYGEGKPNNTPFRHLIESCYPPSKVNNINTLSTIAKIESNGNPLALHVNGYVIPRQPANIQEAQEAISWLSEHQYNFDVGLLQINSSNFTKLGVTGKDLIDPCKNVAASVSILTDCFKSATKSYSKDVLEHSVSCYNTGSLQRGFTNGYVERFKKATGLNDKSYKQKKLFIPALAGLSSSSSNSEKITFEEQSKKKKKSWGVDDIFSNDKGDVFASNKGDAFTSGR